ncbi:39S ribosomal protein L35, mitochondrial-like [Ostrea edulis]|uniref:39S ribosomal protein L35, mitochondrial-like n=1 Tax=Ostrea edulis TaxID=37623 RepID=UPI0024AE8D88|nr:39S ribosomal protein L35, mitochondrial-like [Ostrea edulis]
MAASMIRQLSKGSRVLARQVLRYPPCVYKAEVVATTTQCQTNRTSLIQQFSSLSVGNTDSVTRQNPIVASSQRSLLEACQPFKTTIRTKIRYSKLNKDKTARPVIRRFYRLDWGAWIRTKCGRGKKRFRKSTERKRRLDQHVFCNKQQNKLLDQLVTPFWRKKMYFVDSPYEPYQKRHHITRYFKEKPVFLP